MPGSASRAPRSQTPTGRALIGSVTSSAVAARHYQDGMDALLSYGFDADRAFAAALAADEGFALGHAGAALFALFHGDGASAKASIERARGLVAGATRRGAACARTRRRRRGP